MSQENLDVLRLGFEYVSRTGELAPETDGCDYGPAVEMRSDALKAVGLRE